ncbi:HEPN domain-containing protein [Turicibacter sp. TJ11]|uniref:HEPN domain-containing protein n=1 Tax=Turicibacter sp. TJ11 TaxID=2806443 RepID=UPI00351CBD37
MRNEQEKHILKQFNNSIEVVRQKDEIIQFLSAHGQSTLEIRQSQIILLMSALDLYIHDIVKYCIIQKFNGNQTKTKQYKELLIPMQSVELAIQNPESSDWLDEVITNINQYKSFTSYGQIKNQLEAVGLKSKKINELVLKIESDFGVSNLIEKLRLLRNRLAHQDQQSITSLESELTEEKINQYIDFIYQLVQDIHQTIIELE